MLYSASSLPSTRPRSNEMFDPVLARKVPAEIAFLDTAMTIHRLDGKRMAEWPYAEIVHAFQPEQRRNRALILRSDPGIELTLGEDATYHQLLDRTPAPARAAADRSDR